jgi:hypothetical protein
MPTLSKLAIYRIPFEHLRHLINRLPVESERKEWLLNQASFDDAGAGRTLVFQELAKHYDGLEKRIADLYEFMGRRSLHLYYTPVLKTWDAAKVKDRVRELAGEDRLSFGEFVLVKKKRNLRDSEPRVFSVRVHREFVDAVVRLKKSVSINNEDEKKSEYTNFDVTLRVDLKSANRLSESYADYNDAKRALAVFLSWLTGQDVPTRTGLKQKQFFVGVPFTEKVVTKIATAAGARNYTTRGPDATGVVDEQQFWAPTKGNRKQQLNLNNATLKQQDRLNNSLRGYEFEIKHDIDEFVEIIDVGFNFKGKQPRIILYQRASRVAINQLISSLTTNVLLP